MHNYNNAIVIFDEIVAALDSIIECSIDNDSNINYLDSKYESAYKKKVNDKSEKLLHNAITTLQKNIISASKVIRTGLERELKNIDDSVVCIETDYLNGQEKRRLSIQKLSIDKIRDASLDFDILYKVPESFEPSFVPALESLDGVDTNKIFSDFEKKVISDFPGFFKEEIALAQQDENLDKKDDIVDINNLLSHEYVSVENIKENNNDRLRLIKGAINKARKLGDTKLVIELENKYFEELGKK